MFLKRWEFPGDFKHRCNPGIAPRWYHVRCRSLPAPLYLAGCPPVVPRVPGGAGHAGGGVARAGPGQEAALGARHVVTSVMCDVT